MFELPEFVILAKQMNDTLQGKVIQNGCLGNSPHKFVWCNPTHEEFAQLIRVPARRGRCRAGLHPRRRAGRVLGRSGSCFDPSGGVVAGGGGRVNVRQDRAVVLGIE